LNRRIVLVLFLLACTASNPLEATEQWMGVYLGTTKIGHAFLGVTPGPNEVEVFESLTMSLKMLGQDKTLNTVITAKTASDLTLSSFEFELITEDQTLNVRGELKNRTLEIFPSTGARRTYNVSHKLYLGPTLEAAAVLGRMPEGRIQVFDPSTFSLENAEIRHEGRTSFEHRGTSLEAELYELSYLGTTSRTWVHGGRLLRQESPMNIVTVEEPADEATEVQEGTVDLLKFFSVVPEGSMPNPRDVHTLTLELRNVDPDLLDLDFAGQRLFSKDQAKAVIQYWVDDLGTLRGVSPLPESLHRYLEPTEGIQCDVPEIVGLARQITDIEGGYDDKIRALTQWVYDNLEKRPTVTLPSALEVLNLGYGDCNEHSILFAALARAAGFPADVVVGLLYHEDAYFYHAWNAIWFEGRWVFVDPILNQFPALPDHILLKRGGLDKQAQIVPIVGRIEIEVLEYSE
jgi:transglutaminase-like putative cysteine protease